MDRPFFPSGCFFPTDRFLPFDGDFFDIDLTAGVDFFTEVFLGFDFEFGVLLMFAVFFTGTPGVFPSVFVGEQIRKYYLIQASYLISGAI